jgi:hypothetical protein
VEAAVIEARGRLNLLEQRDEIVPPVGTGPEACNDDDHEGASISPAASSGLRVESRP